MLRALSIVYSKKSYTQKKKMKKKKELCRNRKIQKEKAIKSRFQLSREGQLYPRGQKGDILNSYDYAKDHPFVPTNNKFSLLLRQAFTDTEKQTRTHTHRARKIRSENGTWKLERHFRGRPCERRRAVAYYAAEE